MPSLNLSEWLSGIIEAPNLPFLGLSEDSQSIRANYIYIALPLSGGKHGLDYVENAVANGACAVLSDQPYTSDISIPCLTIANLVTLRSTLYAKYFKTQSLPMPVIGITGTNGKTSVATICAQLLLCRFNKIGLLGTTGNGIVDHTGTYLQSGPLTTLDNLNLHRQLAHFKALHVDVIVMEVSSHGIHQNRIGGIKFSAGVLTNITQDHLDYHGTLAEYIAVKFNFFRQYQPRNWIINVGDEMGANLAKSHPESCITYGQSADADWYCSALNQSHLGIRFTLRHQGRDYPVSAPIQGYFQMENITAAIVVAHTLGIDLEKIIDKATTLQTAAGRMEWLTDEESPSVVIDYAHTPDALTKALKSVKDLTQGQLWCVFGCGGNRDQDKRKKMGAIAQKYADHVIVTDDNPRHEPPHLIRQQVRQGAPDAIEIPNRYDAISTALTKAQSDDVILIAGKGHETTQIIGDVRHEFCDKSVAKKLMAQLKKAAIEEKSELG